MTKPPDLILVNGVIATVSANPQFPAEVSALAIENGRIQAVGDDASIRARASADTQVLDLGGARVVPGLIDSHVHFLRAGRTWNDELRWEDTTSLADALESIRVRASQLPEGRWIRVIGGWDQRQFREGRGPTREELDAVAPRHPVYVQMLYAYAVLNSAGLAALGLNEAGVAASPHPEAFERDANGQLTGRGEGPLMTWFYAQLPPPTFAEQVASTGALSREFGRLGLTGAIDGGGMNTGPDAYGPIYEAWRQGILKTRVRLFKHASTQGDEFEEYAGYLRYEHPRFGDAILQTTGVGEILLRRTHDRVVKAADYSDEAMAQTKDLLERFAAKGWPFQIHVHQREFFLKLLDVFEEIHATTPIDQLRWSFIHAEQTYAEDIPRLRRLGLGLLFQSLFRFSGESAVATWGADKAAHSPELRDLIDAGLPVGFGSDAMRVASYNPWASIQWFLTGLTVSGTPTLKAPHLLSRAEVLRGYTAAGAWFTFEEDTRGQLVPGYWADLAVLDRDYFTVPVEEVQLIESDLTLLGGEVIWDSGRYQIR
jgi:predicted amidohydrolase YtcJ